MKKYMKINKIRCKLNQIVNLIKKAQSNNTKNIVWLKRKKL